MAVTAEDVHNVRFPRAALGTRGYNEVQVDRFLDRVAATLEGEDNISAAVVHEVSFSRTPLGRRGYDEAAVDAFLRLVESTLVAQQVGVPAGGAGPSGPYVAPALEHSHARKPLWRRVVPR
ncbi:DivIVA domain-containing protein [Amycolatopsis cihanbeyliensis]|uniref:Cell wall synthesis protein Wag31 n=1 Tax=Amycolatopsis cihanbeyliensis TaxID=1128664 RepID=A0A542DQY9_AMYCI|nr:DivIVA domain-containing protein [Amycolatopsis cihanbeyliensis]TQJ05404.1 DivIVA domain-containing protein [Amycolatopsis cihanbeyliensis]